MEHNFKEGATVPRLTGVVLSATYGDHDMNKTKDVTLIVQELVTRGSEWKVHNGNMRGDPVPGYGKTLRFTLRESRPRPPGMQHTFTFKEGGQVPHIPGRCLLAAYGDHDNNKIKDVTGLVQALMDKGGAWTLHNGNMHGDPCPGYGKTLRLTMGTAAAANMGTAAAAAGRLHTFKEGCQAHGSDTPSRTNFLEIDFEAYRVCKSVSRLQDIFGVPAMVSGVNNVLVYKLPSTAVHSANDGGPFLGIVNKDWRSGKTKGWYRGTTGRQKGFTWSREFVPWSGNYDMVCCKQDTNGRVCHSRLPIKILRAPSLFDFHNSRSGPTPVMWHNCDNYISYKFPAGAVQSNHDSGPWVAISKRGGSHPLLKEGWYRMKPSRSSGFTYAKKYVPPPGIYDMIVVPKGRSNVIGRIQFRVLPYEAIKKGKGEGGTGSSFLKVWSGAIKVTENVAHATGYDKVVHLATGGKRLFNLDGTYNPELANAIKSSVQNAAKFIVSAVKVAWKFITDLWQKLWDGVMYAFKRALGNFMNMGNAIQNKREKAHKALLSTAHAKEAKAANTAVALLHYEAVAFHLDFLKIYEAIEDVDFVLKDSAEICGAPTDLAKSAGTLEKILKALNETLKMMGTAGGPIGKVIQKMVVVGVKAVYKATSNSRKVLERMGNKSEAAETKIKHARKKLKPLLNRFKTVDKYIKKVEQNTLRFKNTGWDTADGSLQQACSVMSTTVHNCRKVIHPLAKVAAGFSQSALIPVLEKILHPIRAVNHAMKMFKSIDTFLQKIMDFFLKPIMNLPVVKQILALGEYVMNYIVSTLLKITGLDKVLNTIAEKLNPFASLMSPQLGAHSGKVGKGMQFSDQVQTTMARALESLCSDKFVRPLEALETKAKKGLQATANRGVKKTSARIRRHIR